jgi:hypothetical protein
LEKDLGKLLLLLGEKRKEKYRGGRIDEYFCEEDLSLMVIVFMTIVPLGGNNYNSYWVFRVPFNHVYTMYSFG